MGKKKDEQRDQDERSVDQQIIQLESHFGRKGKEYSDSGTTDESQGHPEALPADGDERPRIKDVKIQWLAISSS
jgi:hypothetical protein